MSGSGWQQIYPQGVREISKMLSTYYGGMEVMITECGTAAPNEKYMTLDQRVNDDVRLFSLCSFVNPSSRELQQLSPMRF
jgi:beta-glucosidase/6-phospho-beta-glucosidase/beta-galactosidase